MSASMRRLPTDHNRIKTPNPLNKEKGELSLEESPILPDEAIKEFQQLYRRKFGEWLDEKEARREAENLVRLYEAVYGPDSGSLA